MEITIKSLADELNVKPAQVKSVLDMAPMTKNDTPLDGPQTNLVIKELGGITEDPADESVKPSPVEDTAVIYFWAHGKNQTICVPSGKVEANGVPVPGTFKKTKNSVMKLDKKVDSNVVAYLDKHPGNEANNGISFKRLISLKLEPSEAGKALDDLMECPKAQLAEMNGGGIENHRKSKGTLISELMNK